MSTESSTAEITGSPSWFEVGESYLGGILSLMILVELIVGGIIVVADPPSGNIHVPRIISIPLLAVLLVADGWLLLNTWPCIRDRRFPLGLALAARHSGLPAVHRFPAALAWLGHAALLLGASIAIRTAAETGPRYGLAQGAVFGLLLLVFGMTFLANIYIVLLLTNINPAGHYAKAFWRWRLLIDLALTAAIWLAPIQKKPSPYDRPARLPATTLVSTSLNFA